MCVCVCSRLRLHLTGRNCVENRQGSQHRVFVCTVVMQARQNARDFFHFINFGAFFCTLRSSCYYRRDAVSILVIAEIKLNDLNKEEKKMEIFRSVVINTTIAMVVATEISVCLNHSFCQMIMPYLWQISRNYIDCW